MSDNNSISANKIDLSSPTIDFQKLLREEKSRARRNRRRQQQKAETNNPERQIVDLVGSNNSSLIHKRLSEVTRHAKNTPREDTDGKDGAINQSKTDDDLNDLEIWNEKISTPTLCPLHLLPGPLRSIYYLPQFITPPHASRILKWLQSRPNNDDNNLTTTTNPTDEYTRSIGKWTKLHHAKRRVLLFDARHPSSSHPTLPPPIRQLAHALTASNAFPPFLATPINHVLVNDYRAGEGILPHTDGPEYHPRTATISLGGSDCILRFAKRLSSEEIGRRREEDGMMAEVLLRGNGSLVVFADEAYGRCCHSIREGCLEEVTSRLCVNEGDGVVVRRGYRVSLTFRHKY